jgi:hypothetical protein
MEALLREWLDNIAGPQYASAVMWTVGALVVLVIVLILIRVVRGVSSGTFVAGGRNRRARLAVMDAAAIDNQRRLVLVRRDDVEHLILIGGPTDVVVEQNIVPASALHSPPGATAGERTNGPAIRPAPQAEGPAPQRPRAALQERREPDVAVEIPPRTPEPVQVRPEPAASLNRDAATPLASSSSVHFLDKARIGPAPQAPSMAPLTVAASAAATRPAEARAPEMPTPEIPAPEPEIASPAAVRSEPDRRMEPSRSEARAADLDSALREELRAPLVRAPEERPAAEQSLEEEMKRLLGELSTPARG